MVKVFTDKMSVTKEQIEASHDLEVDVPGISPRLKSDLENRIEDFETHHEWDALHGGNGWVKRIQKNDVIIALCINVIFITWWLIAIMT